MLASLQNPPWMFNLEGTFLGFLGQDPAQAEYLWLGLDDEEVSIRLPQSVRRTVKSHLQPGDVIRITGRSTLNFETGVLSLRAYQVFAPPPHSPVASRVPC